MLSLYEIKGLKEEQSILRSVLVTRLEGDRKANVKIDVKAVDRVYRQSIQFMSRTYILGVIEKQFTYKVVREKMAKALGYGVFRGALVTYYDHNDEVIYETYVDKWGNSEKSVLNSY